MNAFRTDRLAARAFMAAMFALVAMTYIAHPDETHRKPREPYTMERYGA